MKLIEWKVSWTDNWDIIELFFNIFIPKLLNLIWFNGLVASTRDDIRGNISYSSGIMGWNEGPYIGKEFNLIGVNLFPYIRFLIPTRYVTGHWNSLCFLLCHLVWKILEGHRWSLTEKISQQIWDKNVSNLLRWNWGIDTGYSAQRPICPMALGINELLKCPLINICPMHNAGLGD